MTNLTNKFQVSSSWLRALVGGLCFMLLMLAGAEAFCDANDLQPRAIAAANGQMPSLVLRSTSTSAQTSVMPSAVVVDISNQLHTRCPGEAACGEIFGIRNGSIRNIGLGESIAAAAVVLAGGRITPNRAGVSMWLDIDPGDLKLVVG